MPDPLDGLPRLYVKSGVDLDGLSPGGCRILSVAAMAPLVLGFPITLTCGKEGHGPADPHTKGNGIDIRTKGMTALQVLKTHSYFTQQLGTDLFTVLYEVPEAERADLDPLLTSLVYLHSDPDAEHLHCQVRIGKEFPSAPRPA